MILTIAIPTYNRPDKVTNTLLQLIPQLTDDVCIKVLDNCSDTNVKDYISDKLGSISNAIEVIRHRVNVGADANFQRCFEYCDTPYIWMIGDDDRVEEDAVRLIFSELEKYKELDLIGINFKSNCLEHDRPSPILISSTKELSEKLDHFGNWLFISTTVYKTAEYLKYLNYAMWGAYSMASQVVPAMFAISNHKVFVLSEKYLVSNIPEAADKKWSNYQLAMGLSSILETRVGFKEDEYKEFAKRFSILIDCIYPGEAFYSILKSVDFNIDLIDNYHIYIYKQLFMKTFDVRFSRKSTQLRQYHICLFLLKNKSALKILLKIFSPLKQKANNALPFFLFKR